MPLGELGRIGRRDLFVGGGLVLLGQERPKPGATPVVANRALGDAVEPAAQVATVELGQLAPHDQKDLLGEIVEVGVEAAERASPARHLVKPLDVDLLEGRPLGAGLFQHPRVREQLRSCEVHGHRKYMAVRAENLLTFSRAA